jgi:hypothetical protein
MALTREKPRRTPPVIVARDLGTQTFVSVFGRVNSPLDNNACLMDALNVCMLIQL